MILLFLCCLLFQDSEPSRIDQAMLASMKNSQVSLQPSLQDRPVMFRNMLAKVKLAKIKPQVRKADGYGVIVDGQYYVQTKKLQQEAIEYYRAQLVEAENEAKKKMDEMLPIIDCRDLSTGLVGFIGTSNTGPAEIKIIQVLNKSKFLGRVGSEFFIVDNVSTVDLTDGKALLLPLPVEVMGTERYATAVGATNTVFVLRMLDRDEFDKAMAYVNKNKLRLRPVLREWKDVNGDILAKGSYVTQDKLSVTIADSDGVESKVELLKLSKEDRLWLKDK